MGLEYKAETKLAYAEYFKMYHYDEGITLLEIDMTKDTERDPEKQNEDDKRPQQRTPRQILLMQQRIPQQQPTRKKRQQHPIPKRPALRKRKI